MDRSRGSSIQALYPRQLFEYSRRSTPTGHEVSLKIPSQTYLLISRPIPIELTASSTRYSSLPKLTLQSGLAHALGATAAVGAVADPALGRVLADAACRPGQPMGEGMSFPLGTNSGDHGSAGRLRARKKAGLKVKTSL